LVGKEIGSLVKPGAKKPPAVGLLKSVVMVVVLMRKNVTQQFAAGIFGCSQPADRQPPLGPDPARDRESAPPVRAGPGRRGRPSRNAPGRRHDLPDLGLVVDSRPVFGEGEVPGYQRADRVQS